MKRVRDATIEELAEVIGPSVAERVHAFLHTHKDGEDAVRDASLEDAGSPIAE